MMVVVPEPEIININQIVSVNLVHLINTPLFEKVIPSKIFESMALRKPIIMGVNGESNNIIQNANCGFSMVSHCHVDLRPTLDEYLVSVFIFEGDADFTKQKCLPFEME